MAIHVGCSDTSPPRAGYLKRLAALELLPSQEVPPKAASAARWLDQVPEGFRFTMVASRLLSARPATLPPGLTGEPGRYGDLQLSDEVRRLHDRTLEAALALKARVLVFVTTPNIRPGPRGREAISRFFSTVERGGLTFAWEPHGVWADEEVLSLCGELDLVRCVDPLRDEVPESPTGLAYGRLGPFAVMGRSMADDELDDIVDALSGFDEAYCFLGTERAMSDASRLMELCAP